MGVLDKLKQFTSGRKNIAYAKMMNGSVPVFSMFGNDVYVSDLVNNAIDRIATQMSKLNPRHIRVDYATGIEKTINSSINRLLKFGPNELMTTSDFLYKIVYLRERTNNAYIYPTWERVELGNGKYKRKYTGFYPLNPIEVDYLEDEASTLWIRFHFLNGQEFTMRYRDIIHWRKNFSENDFQGGDVTGKPDTRAQLKLLQADDTILQGISNGIKMSMAVNGILKIGILLDDEHQEEERIKFENKLKRGESGILVEDMKAEYTPMKIDPKFIDKDTIEFIEKRILANHGVSLPIYNGEFTEEEYQAFYEGTLEHQIISLGRVFSKTVFTEAEMEIGDEICCYNQGLLFTSTANKIKAAEILTNIGVLTDNQVLGIFGYPPFVGGDKRKQSLNYINREIADQYQLGKNQGKEKANE